MLRGLYQNIFDNPILTRELRRRMRGKALVYSMIGYIMLMAFVAILVLLFNIGAWKSGETQELLKALSNTGQSLFKSITIIQVLLVLIIAPTITAGMTTGEKEKKTFDFLRVTTITPWMYIVGCFLSTVFYVALALLCALPLVSLAFLYGGVGRADVLVAALGLLGGSMILSSLGLYISSTRERTRTAQGIVVFLIFGMLFFSFGLVRQILSWLGTGTGGGGIGDFVVFGVTLPWWSTVLVAVLALTGVFLLVAARKLFEPEETRAFSHWQFALLFALIIGVFLSAASGGIPATLAEENTLFFLAVGCVLLMVAVGCFAVGRMEVGDEIWHLKRLVPILRPLDQTIPYLLLMGLGWFYAVMLFQKLPNSLGTVPGGMFMSFLLVSLAGFAFFCAFGRFATAVAVGRKGAVRMALAVMVGCWFLMPIFALVLLAVTDASSTDMLGTILGEIGRFSPFYVMVEGIEDPSLYRGYTLPPGAFPSLVYGVLAVAFLGWGEVLRFRRWRKFDYHYDMPAR